MKTMLDEALDLLIWDWAIFPVHGVRQDGTCTCGKTTEEDGKRHKPGKHPRTKNGWKDASKDPEVVKAWWHKHGWMQSSIGLSCGAVSGVWVLDVDLKPPCDKAGAVLGMTGPEALAAYEAAHGPLPQTLESKTGSGGRQLFWRIPDGRRIRNHVKLKGPDGRTCSLDVRSDGGYVVLPPSTHESGNRYEWTRKMWPPAEAPAWLLDLVDPPRVEPERRERTADPYQDRTRAEHYASKALENACARVAATGEGGRNDGLNREAYAIAGYVGAGHLDEFRAREDLVNAGLACGLGEKEARGIVTRALAAGAAKPVEPRLQEREWEPSEPGLPPQMPEDDEYWEGLDAVAPPDGVDDEVGAPIMDVGVGTEKALPSIVCAKRQGQVIIEEAWAALKAMNDPPRMWLQNGSLVGIRKSERGPTIRILTPTDVLGSLMRCARWVKWRKARDNEASKSGFVHEDVEHPPTFVADDMHAMPDESLPILEGITFAPCYSAKGRLLDRPGYNPEGRCYYDAPHGLKRVAMTAQDAMLLLFGDWLGDFPFASDADRAHALALLLLPFVRRMIAGPTPGHVIEAPVPGSGKSLLAKCLTRVFLGFEPRSIPFSDNEEERRKAFVTALVSGRPTLLVDNVNCRLDSATVAGMLTTTAWADRETGFMKEIIAPNFATWIFTVNNADMSVEMARRCVRIRLDPRCERPEDRTGFRVTEPLESWTMANRDLLLSACLSIVDYWLTHRAPYTGPVMGSFESWAQTMGGIVQSLGMPGFLQDRRAFREATDNANREWSAFVQAVTSRPTLDPWWTVKELIGIAEEAGILARVMGDGNERSRQIRMGSALQKRRDTVTDGWRLEVGSGRAGTVYRFEKVA